VKVETYKVVPSNRGAMRTREGPTVNLNELIESGHFPKKYDPSRRIPNDVVDKLLKFIYSIPTSVNAQSTHYLVASTPESRSRIADHMGEGFDFNVPKVRDASHIIVLATRETLSNEYLDELHAKEVADGKFPTEALADQWQATVRMWIDLHRYDVKDLQHWMEKQTYLALGMSLMAAEELGINASPLEGFNSRILDAELGLRQKGFTATVLLVLGYRDEADFYARTPKSRLPMDRHFTFLK
jgi:nitroreductase/dihydropteridine reductase